MRQAINRFLLESTSASRCLLAIGAASPVLVIYMLVNAWALGSPEVRPGLRPEVMWAEQGLLTAAQCILWGLALWLWPRRQEATVHTSAEGVVAGTIGLVYTAMPILAGSSSAGPTLALLGVSVMGLLLFQWQTMAVVILLCGGTLLAYNLMSLIASVPYAPVLTAQAFEHGEARWWWAAWQGMVLYIGLPCVVAIIMMLFANHDALHQRLRHLSSTDGLTGLANRRQFMARLQAELARQKRNGQPLTLLLIDADHFKRINDRHGHAKGDEVLVALAQILALGVRTPTDLAARLGGEEFALLLPATTLEEAQVVCRRLQMNLQACRFTAIGESFGLTVSMGGVQCRGVHAQQLLRQVDDNLYRAKAAGRNRAEYSVMEVHAGDEAHA